MRRAAALALAAAMWPGAASAETSITPERITVISDAGAVQIDRERFSLRVLDPETAEVDPDSPGVAINEAVEVQPRESISIGRAPDVVDADGEQVAATFEGGEPLDLGPGDQVALLDSGGAVANTITV